MADEVFGRGSVVAFLRPEAVAPVPPRVVGEPDPGVADLVRQQKAEEGALLVGEDGQYERPGCGAAALQSVAVGRAHRGAQPRDPPGAAACLLDRVRKFVGEDVLAPLGRGRVLPGTEHDVASHGAGERVEAPDRRGGGRPPSWMRTCLKS